jgi:hypothetical protein
MKLIGVAASGCIGLLLLGAGANALPLGARLSVDTLSIRELQVSTAAAEWRSAYENQIVSLTGGVVTHKIGFRITLQDPSLGTEWAGVEIRAYQNEAPLGVVQVGDRVDFHDVLVEEFRGGTIPQFMSYSTFEVVSSGNPLPDPIVVPLADLRYPPDRERCEKYEGMLVTVENVRVGRMDWGKADDDYELFDEQNSVWASDYYNLDLAVPPFPTYYVQRGERYSRISGIFQEYLYPQEGWDYYQLLPRGAGDYVKSDIYTIRDVQESSQADGWSSILVGIRLNLQAIVSAPRSSEGLVALGDPLLGGEWAGLLVRDPQSALSGLAVGNEVRFENVLVTEEQGLTAVLFDAESGWTLKSVGNAMGAVVVSPQALRRGAGPEASERYEGMLVAVTNTRVVQRGVPEGNGIYYLVAGSDTLLATDAECTAVPPDSTFFVRPADRLGSIRGIVVEREIAGAPAYVMQPRTAEDYYFMAGNLLFSSWATIKSLYR